MLFFWWRGGRRVCGDGGVWRRGQNGLEVKMAFVLGAAVAGRRGRRCAVRCRDSEGQKDGGNATLTPQDIRARVERRVRDEGVRLDDLMNPAKVLDLETKLEFANDTLSDAERENIKNTLIREKRLVMRDWLRRLFVIQGWGGAALGGVLASGHVPLVPDVPLAARALGFWLVWLITIPALRARKPAKWEKSALNVAFLAIIFANIGVPFVNKDPFTIWLANMAIMGACYAYYNTKSSIPEQKGESAKLKGVLKWFDWGSWR
mmetsp:Transcript_12353/g.37676  ORF Transcript_12353/g.37676 Transcript_12353/m.37676 type:complete len:262 (+) Transcript_12353:23-808(+)